MTQGSKKSASRDIARSVKGPPKPTTRDLINTRKARGSKSPTVTQRKPVEDWTPGLRWGCRAAAVVGVFLVTFCLLAAHRLRSPGVDTYLDMWHAVASSVRPAAYACAGFVALWLVVVAVRFVRRHRPERAPLEELADPVAGRLAAKVAAIVPGSQTTVSWDGDQVKEVTIQHPQETALVTEQTVRLEDVLNDSLGLSYTLRYDPKRDRSRFWDRPDPLRQMVPAGPIAEPVDLTKVRVGVHEDGSPFYVRLLGNHYLIAGATGAGKGSVEWAIVRALAPDIRSGRVRMVAIDPKGGMELGPGEALWARFSCGRVSAEDMRKDPYARQEQMVSLLEDEVRGMLDRAERFGAAGIRKPDVFTPETPFVVVMVDEVLSLIDNVPSKLKERAMQALSTLGQVGRAIGYCMILATQNPKMDRTGVRDMVTQRILLRVNERSHVDMVLGAGARAAGALADRIPEGERFAGIGYALPEGSMQPERFRAEYSTDDEIAALVTEYAIARETVPE